MLHEIIYAEAHSDHTVTIRWADGAQGTVDFTPVVARGKVFKPMQDALFFVRELRVLPRGLGLSWPPELDFSADGLRAEAFPEDDEDCPFVKKVESVQRNAESSICTASN